MSACWKRVPRLQSETVDIVFCQCQFLTNSMFMLDDLDEAIASAIVNRTVADRASSDLYRIRKRMLIVEERIRQKLNDILRSDSYAAMLQDTVIQERSGRLVVPPQRR